MSPTTRLLRLVSSRLLLRGVLVATALAGCALAGELASSGPVHPAKPLGMARAAAATGTPVCGEVGGSNWTAVGSPYLICSSGVTVASGSTLTIDASLGSVSVIAQGSGGITVSGTLSTAGTTQVNVVTLTSATASPGAWSGISTMYTGGQYPSITLSNTSISYAFSALTNTCPACSMSLTAVSIQQTSSVAIRSYGSLSMSGGSITDAGELATIDQTAPPASGILASGPTTVQGTSFTTAPSSAIVLANPGGTQTSATVTGVSISGVGTHDGAAITVDGGGYSPLTIQNNTITNSGFGGSGYPAIRIHWAAVDLAHAISGNGGSGNYLDALWCDQCSASTSFTWVSASNGSAKHPFGYLLSNGLNLQGNTLTVPANGTVKVLRGGLYEGRVAATAGGAVFTSLADNTVGISACPSVLVQSCAATPGDWDGIDDYSQPHQSSPLVSLTTATIKYAAIGVDVEFDGQTLPAKPAGADAALSGVTITHGFGGVAGVDASISYNGGTVADMVDNPNASTGDATPPPAFWTVAGYGILVIGDGTISGVSVQRTDDFGISVRSGWSNGSTAGGTETITNNTIDHADRNTLPTQGGALAVEANANPQGDPVTVKNNIITNSGSASSQVFAVHLQNVTGDLGSMVSGNVGGGNYSDTIWFEESVDTASLTWISPQNSSASHPLGFAGRLTMQGAGTLTIPSGAVVKTNLVLDGARLDATAGGATFDIPTDDSVGPPTCFAFSNPCVGGAGNDIIDAVADTNGHRGNIAISNATMLETKQPQCSEAILATSGATSTAGSLTYGVVLSNVAVRQCGAGGVVTDQTPMLITGGSFTEGGVFAHGPLSVSGTSFTGSSAGVFDEPDSYGAPVGPLTVTHCSFSQAATGVEAMSVTSLSITGSSFTGGGTPIVIEHTTVDLATDLSGNTVASNTADEVLLVLDTDTGSFTWPAAVNSSTPHAPYFAVEYGLTVDDATMTMAANSVYSDTNNALLFQGGHLDAQAGGVVFTGPPCTPNCGFVGIQLRASTSSMKPAATATLNGATITHANHAMETFDSASASVTCSTLYENTIGVLSGGAGVTVSQSTLPGETYADVNATVPTNATNDWWGQASGPRQSQTSGPVTTSPFLTAAPACAPPVKPGGRALASASSTQQYTMSGSDGHTWTAVDPANLAVSFTPSADGTAVIVANADLWTDTAGFNQDIGIEVSVGSYDPGELLAWHESGGFAGTLSPNAAAVQARLYVQANTTYSITLVWKANKPMPSSARIHIGAGPLGGSFSPTTLHVLSYPVGTVQTVESTNQYQLTTSDGNSWADVDASKLRLILTPSVASTALLSANADLWTAAAGINQDIAFNVSPPCAGGASPSRAWHESGGYAGTYSPNAAFVQETCGMAANTTYTVTLQWKSNKPMQSSSGIYIGAGPLSSSSYYSPTSLYGVLEPGASPWTGATSASQYSLAGSDGQTWQDVDTSLQRTFTASQNCTAHITANADLWTATGGVNQDLGIAVARAGQPGSVVAWHESGGFAGTFSPNAAFVQASVPLSSGVTYTISLEWKSNKAMSPNDRIFMGAGSSGTGYSPTTLIIDLDC